MLSHVAIDGPVGSGKTTVARRLAARVGLLYLDSGAMYRAVAFLALRGRIDPDNEEALVRLARAEPIDMAADAGGDLGFRVSAGGHDLGPELYDNDVSAVAAVVATHPRIRELLVERQQAIARGGAVVMAGRDIGTVVLPDAPVKIFLTASVERRVERRLAELEARGVRIDPIVLRAQIVERDRLDENRAVAPLRPAAGATIIDSSELSVDDVVDLIEPRVRTVAGA